MRLRVACKAAFLLVVALMVAVMVAAPASAGESQCDEWNPCPPPPPDNGGGNNGSNNGGNGPHKQRHDDLGNNGAPALSQDFEQEADSGDIDQSFNVTGGGDNSNQTVGLQGVANTGNAQNQIGIAQLGSDADDFEFEDVGSLIDVSPTNRTSAHQEVNQAAAVG